MTRRLLRALLPALLALSAPARAQPTDAELLSWADSFETSHGAGPRAPIEGDYVTRYGTLVHSSCLAPLSRQDRARAAAQLEQDLLSTLRVVRACAEAYPMLTGLLADDLAVLRRSVIGCVAGAPQQSPAYSFNIQTLESPYSHGRTVGEPARNERHYYIQLPGDLAQFNSNAVDYRLMTYFHEPLHYTGANNRGDHNVIENIPYNPKKPCARNNLDDRIAFLQTVCGFPVPRLATLDDVADRIRRCPPEDRPRDDPGGCLAMLIDRDPNPADTIVDPHMYGRPFAPREAELLCRQVRERALRDSAPRQRRGRAYGRVKMTYRDLLDREGRTLLTETPMPAPRYLAPLSGPERAQIASNPAFTRLGLLCRAAEDGSLDPVGQPYDCPLGSGSPLFPLTRRLVEFNNREARLIAESRRLLDSLLRRDTSAADLDRAQEETEELYGELCPDGDGAAFRPRLCAEGELVLLEDIAALRRAQAP